MKARIGVGIACAAVVVFLIAIFALHGAARLSFATAGLVAFLVLIILALRNRGSDSSPPHQVGGLPYRPYH